MEIPVLVEPVPGRGFRASATSPFAISVEGPNRQTALAGLRLEIAHRMKDAELLFLSVPANPWATMAGWLRDDPAFDEWQAAIAEHRQEEDSRHE